VSTLLISVLLPEPGGEHLARHLREPLELAVLDVVTERLSELEYAGFSVTSEVVEVEPAP
jgi:hypothetical protein